MLVCYVGLPGYVACWPPSYGLGTRYVALRSGGVCEEEGHSSVISWIGFMAVLPRESFSRQNIDEIRVAGGRLYYSRQL